MKKWFVLAGGAAVAGALFVPVGGGNAAEATREPRARAVDLASYSDAKPNESMSLLFIHHSCGGQLLAPAGESKETARCVYESHPNGGGLAGVLEAQGYDVHQASYGSEIGEDTDLFDWLPKFRDKMDKVLRVKLNDELLPDGERNDIVVFKSCFPNNDFVGEGEIPGNPAGPELTVTNAKAALSALLSEFEKHPEVLFVYVTAPANAPEAPSQPAWKWLVKTALGKPHPADIIARQATLARAFNRWVADENGWLKGYTKNNVVVFDYYAILTGGESDLSKYPTGDGRDSHPSREGNERAAREFIPLLNRAVRRSGLSR